MPCPSGRACSVRASSSTNALKCAIASSSLDGKYSVTVRGDTSAASAMLVASKPRSANSSWAALRIASLRRALLRSLRLSPMP